MLSAVTQVGTARPAMPWGASIPVVESPPASMPDSATWILSSFVPSKRSTCAVIGSASSVGASRYTGTAFQVTPNQRFGASPPVAQPIQQSAPQAASSGLKSRSHTATMPFRSFGMGSGHCEPPKMSYSTGGVKATMPFVSTFTSVNF